MKNAIPFTAVALLLAGCVSAPEARPTARQPAPVERTAASFPVRQIGRAHV